MKHLTIHTKSIDERARAVDVIASTDATDTHGESLDQKTWSTKRYERNPVVLYGHDSHDLPIGRATDVRVERGALRAKIHFASAEANPRAEQVFQLVREGVLNAVSVGFLPGRVTTEQRDGKEVTILSQLDLFEISVVPVPANPEALMRMRSAGRAEQQHEPPPTLGDLALRQATTGERHAQRREDLTDLADIIKHDVGITGAE